MNLGDAGSALPLVLLGVMGGALLLAAIARMTKRRRHVQGGPASTTAPAEVRQDSAGFAQTLRALHAAGRWDELLRLLDRTLPEWTVSSSLIEVARAVSELERDIAAHHGSEISDVGYHPSRGTDAERR